MKKFFICLTVLLFMFGVLDLAAKTPKATQKDIVKVSASSEMEGNTAVKAFDGDFGSRWESEHGVDPGWITVKFKKKRLINAIRIKWEASAASMYQIKISDDGKKWKKVTEIKNGLCNENRIIKFKKPLVTKYLMIFGKERTMEYGYSIVEVKLNPVILNKKDNVKIIKAESSSINASPDMDLSAAMAVDGNMETRWDSECNDPQWITVELKKKTKIKAVKINWEAASAKVYAVQVSTDKKKWKEAAKIENGSPAEEKIIKFKPVKAKYVRIYGEKRNGEWGYSIWEIKVFK